MTSQPPRTAGSGARVFVFKTTHHAMWAEDVAREQSIPAEVVPAPPQSEAKCGVALQIQTGGAAELATALDREGIVYEVFSSNS